MNNVELDYVVIPEKIEEAGATLLLFLFFLLITSKNNPAY